MKLQNDTAQKFTMKYMHVYKLQTISENNITNSLPKFQY